VSKNTGKYNSAAKELIIDDILLAKQALSESKINFSGAMGVDGNGKYKLIAPNNKIAQEWRDYYGDSVNVYVSEPFNMDKVWPMHFRGIND